MLSVRNSSPLDSAGDVGMHDRPGPRCIFASDLPTPILPGSKISPVSSVRTSVAPITNAPTIQLPVAVVAASRVLTRSVPPR